MTKKNIVVKGNKYHTFYNVYSLEFIKNKHSVEKCPSCGGDIIGNICPYCHTVLKGQSNHFVLCNKKLKK